VEGELLNWPRRPGPSGPGPEHAADGPAARFDEPGPPPGQDATLLAVVPIPGTGTSLAIVGYVIATSASQPPAVHQDRPLLDRDRPPSPPDSQRPQRTSRTPSPGLRLDQGRRRVWADGREVRLTFQEFELLAFLIAHPAQVFTRADLVDQVWHRDLGHDGRPIPRDSRTVDVHVSRLRHKLGPRHGQCLVTEYRVGYQFRPLAR